MSPKAPDKTLLRLVANLARAHDDDVQSVLSELEDDQREKVKRLLADCTGLRPYGPIEPRPDSALPAGVSDWLVARLAVASGTGLQADAGAFAMAPRTLQAALEALRDLPRVQPATPASSSRLAVIASAIFQRWMSPWAT